MQDGSLVALSAVLKEGQPSPTIHPWGQSATFLPTPSLVRLLPSLPTWCPL